MVNYLVSSTSPVRATDAVAALLVLEDGRYLLQHRDDKPQIWYPDYWGLFGGAIEEGETLIAALRRELKEELELELEPESCTIEWFTRFDFDLSGVGQGLIHRSYYVIPVAEEKLGRLRLHEGTEVRAFSAAEVFGELKVVPYDSFALWLHYARGRLHLG
jgi:8-oxo-dGTP pyrophosphatase MutT (NUDIX family)